MRRALVLLVWLTVAGCAHAPGEPSSPLPGGRLPGVPPPPPPPLAPQIRYTRFLAFGDSLTEGLATPDQAPAPSIVSPDYPKAYPSKLYGLLIGRYIDQTIEVRNAGRGGDRAGDSSTVIRLNQAIAANPSDVMILWIGVNDLNGGAPIDPTVESVLGLADIGRSAGLQVLVCNLIAQASAATNAAKTVPFNGQLAQRTAARGYPLIDLFSQVPASMLAPDGLHLTEAGNVLVAEVIFARLRDLYELPPPTDVDR